MSQLKKTKEMVKKLAGKNYSLQFRDYLIREKVFNRNNTYYSPSHIRNYFSTDTNGSKALDEHFKNFWKQLLNNKKREKEKLKELELQTKELS